MGLTEMFAAVCGIGGATAVLIVLIDSVAKTRQSHRKPISASEAEAILAERYARGEIDDAEYSARVSTLRIGPPLQLP